MGRQRAIAVTVALILGLALIGVGLRYSLTLYDRHVTEDRVADLKERTRHALDLLHRISTERAAVDAQNSTAQAERDRVLAIALALHNDLDRAQSETTSSLIGAYTSGAEANNLSDCLIGVSQALNQLSVGDFQAVQSLAKVDGPCRAAGV